MPYVFLVKIEKISDDSKFLETYHFVETSKRKGPAHKVPYQSYSNQGAGQLNHIASVAIHSKTKGVELSSRKLIEAAIW